MQGYNLEIRHIPGKRNLADTLSRQDKKDALGRKTVVHDVNADLVKVLRVPSDANDVAIQEALMKLFNAHTRDQIESVAVEGQVSRAKRSVTDPDQALKAQKSVTDSDQALKAQKSVTDSDQALKAQRSVTDSEKALKASDSVSDQFSPVHPKSESKTSRSVQFKPEVSVSSSNQSSSQCTLAASKSSINIDNSLRDRIHSLL